jgi:hypothetical protein
VTDKGCSGKWVTRIEKMRNPSKSILHILIFLIIIETGRSVPKLLSAYEWTARINISGIILMSHRININRLFTTFWIPSFQQALLSLLLLCYCCLFSGYDVRVRVAISSSWLHIFNTCIPFSVRLYPLSLSSYSIKPFSSTKSIY